MTQHLRDGKQWKHDERLIIFTEYKTTLDYLFLRFKSEFQGDYESRIRILFGGKSQAGLMNRDEVIAAFNDPEDPIRILIATDVASEGLNLAGISATCLPLRYPLEPIAAGTTQRSPGPARASPRRHRLPFHERR